MFTILVDPNIGIHIQGLSVILNVFCCTKKKEVFRQMLSLWMLPELVFKRCCTPAMGLKMTTIKD